MSVENKTIIVASTAELKNKVYYRRLWLAVRNLKDITRRGWLDELANTFRDYEHKLLWPEGDKYHLPEIDDVFNNDLCMRWFGYFVAADHTGDNPLTRCNRLERLRLLDLYFKMKYPNIAEHFSK